VDFSLRFYLNKLGVSALKKIFQVETVVFLCIWFLLVIIGPSRLFRDPGTFWHTIVGEHILSSHNFIHTDFFSFTFEGKYWIAQQWLGECIMAIIHKLGGLDGLLIMTAFALAFLYAWVAHLLRRKGLHNLLVLLVVAMTFAGSSIHLHVRPHIVSILMLAYTFSRLQSFEAGRSGLNDLFWLMPLYVLWTNIHGGVLGGLGTIGLAIGGWSFAKITKQDSPIKDYREMLTLGIFFVLCCLTILINPYGIEMPRAWFSIMLSPVIPKIIIEHSSVMVRRDLFG
jgi:hypothetical protein